MFAIVDLRAMDSTAMISMSAHWERITVRRPSTAPTLRADSTAAPPAVPASSVAIMVAVTHALRSAAVTRNAPGPAVFLNVYPIIIVQLQSVAMTTAVTLVVAALPARRAMAEYAVHPSVRKAPTTWIVAAMGVAATAVFTVAAVVPVATSATGVSAMKNAFRIADPRSAVMTPYVDRVVASAAQIKSA